MGACRSANIFPEQRFSFTIEESWHFVEETLSSQAWLPVRSGVEKIRQLWEERKSHLLPAFDQNTGRIVAGITTKESHDIATVIAHRDVRMPDSLLKTARDMGTVDSHRVCHAITCLAEEAKVEPEEIVLNALVRDRDDPRPGREGKYIQKGTKLGKYISLLAQYKFGSCVDGKDVELIVNALSVLTAQYKPKDAIVVLSVNPLDILLASMCTTSWESCHNIAHGEWRTGPIDFLCDGTTAIAYAYTEDDWKASCVGPVLPHKFWRQMVYFDVDHYGALFSKNYPVHIPVLESRVRELTVRVLTKLCGLDAATYATIIHPQPHHVSEWHHPDPCTSGVMLLNPNNGWSHVMPAIGSDEIPCISCGKMRLCWPASNVMRAHLDCPECGEYDVYCPGCGKQLRLGNDSPDLVWSNGSAFCAQCGETVIY